MKTTKYGFVFFSGDQLQVLGSSTLGEQTPSKHAAKQTPEANFPEQWQIKFYRGS